MNNGWIKLHRKVQESEIWNDQNAWRVFQWLLMNVDYKTGKGTFGKKKLADGTGIKVGTIYKVVTRLQEKYSVLSTKSSQFYTEISILNWAKYQHEEESVVSTVQETQTAAYKKSNTIKEIKNIRNKEIKKEREENSLTYLENLSEEEIKYFTEGWDLTRSQLIKKAQQLRDYCLANGKKYKNYKAFLRNAVSRDFKTRPQTISQPEYDFNPAGVARVKKMKDKLLTIKTMDRPIMTDFEMNERRNYLDKQAKDLN